MKAWSSAIVLGVLLQVTSAHAQNAPPKTLRVEDVITRVTTETAQARAIVEDVSVADGDALSARGGFDPVLRGLAGQTFSGDYPLRRYDVSVEQPTTLYGLTAAVGYRLGQGTFAVYDGKQQTNSGGEVRALLRLPVLQGGPIDRRRALVSRTKLGQEGARFVMQDQRISLARNATVRYWEWVAATLRVKAGERWLALAETRDAQLTRRAERGDIATIERDDNRRTILQRRAQLLALKRDAQQLALDLGGLLVGPNGEAPMLDETLAPRDLPEPQPLPETAEAGVALALGRRPDLQVLGVARRQVEIDAELAENQRLPGLDVTVAVSRDLGVGVADKYNRPVFEALVDFDMPLLFRTAQGRMDAANAQARKLVLQRTALAERIRRDVLSSRLAVETAVERAKLTDGELSLARTLRDAEERRFFLGEGSLVILNLREQAEVEADLRHVDALLDFQRAMAVYRAATGG